MLTIRSRRAERGRARHAERGQTLPIWTLAVLTALTLMFFSLNYANVLRWQVRAQNAADAAATAALTVQANQWNKVMTILYAADVEEWRIRHLIQAMIDTSSGSGGCTWGNNGGSCLRLYGALQVQYYKAVNRYTTEVRMLQSMASLGATSQAADGAAMIHSLRASCATPNPLVDCAFTYHIVDYSYRTTTEQAGKDAFYLQLGGFTSPEDSAPVADWEPARIEIATCAKVEPIVNFSVFGPPPTPFTVIGRSAATNVTQTAEWFAPGVTEITSALKTANPLFASNVYFQSAENYDPADDTFGSVASPRDWYETQYPAIGYVALPQKNIQNYIGHVRDDFEVMVCWWAAIPATPYTTATQLSTTLCTQS